jgi:ApaG protein
MAHRSRTQTPDTYVGVTRGVRVLVSPRFVAERSDPEASRYFWAYDVRIENVGQETLRLVSRHWVITDGMGRMEEVRGPGVVGEQPLLEPGGSFEYTSGCPLSTPSGAMRGDYRMVAADGEGFDAAIPAFSLHLPGAARRLN